MVREYKGAYSGEHGDGLCRGEWVAWQFGPRLDRAFAQVKALFDPENRMNPGKIVSPPRMDDASLFRTGPRYKRIALVPKLDWSQWNVERDPLSGQESAPGTGDDSTLGLAKAVEMCNNNGHCRKFDAGTMCPSYRATRDEQHVTRGRANTLRLALSGQFDGEGLASDAVRNALELCVSCKGCKRECPTGVDMAKLKIEALAALRARKGLSLRDRLVAYLPRYAPAMSRIGSIVNLRDRSRSVAALSERLVGLSARRSLDALLPFARRSVAIVGLEPSCLLGMRDEFLDYGFGDEAKLVASQALMLEEFLVREREAGRLALELHAVQPSETLLHAHCHQKAFGAVSPIEKVLGWIPELTTRTIESSCCGMAGAFGYEAEHYDVSMRMAEAALLPAIREMPAPAWIVADGFSCRQQIRDGTHREAMHVARVLEQALRQ